MSTSSRVALLLTIALVACMYLVSAAPIANDDTTTQLELGSVSPFRINMSKRHKNNDETTTKSRKHKHKKTATTTTAKATSTLVTKKNASSSGSSSYSGDATYYGTGLGSCGHDSKDTDLIVALNYRQMDNGANPNKNPLCGKKITAKGPSGSVTVTIVDTCPGCAEGDLDLSPAAFSKIANMALGRVPVTWSFN